MKHFGSGAMLLLGIMAVTPAFAGIADTPLPVLEAGKKTYHVYSVPGVIEQNIVGTFFSCTSTDTAAMKVGIQLFDTVGYNGGVDPVGTLTILPGETRTFGTMAAAGINIDSMVGVGIGRGSARILATSRKLVCTAFVADPGSAPPAVAWQLTIVKKTTQKGD
jgi:hypothetical protein